MDVTEYRYNSTSGGTGTAFTLALNVAVSGDLQAVFAGFVATGGVDGTVDVFWDFSVAPGEGFDVGFIFFTDAGGINDADMIRWIQEETNQQITINSNAGDIVIGYVESFEDVTPVLDTAATELWTPVSHAGDQSTAGDITTVGDPTTTVQGDGRYGCVLGVSILDGSVGGFAARNPALAQPLIRF